MPIIDKHTNYTLLYLIIPVGRNCTGRLGYGSKLTWVEIAMGRNVQ